MSKHSQRALARNTRFGGDLFPSNPVGGSSSSLAPVERSRPLPEQSYLSDFGITQAEFAARHRVVMCSLCQSAQSRNSFLMLQYIVNTPGQRRLALGARPQVKGTNREGSSRVIWAIAPGLTAVCDEGHITRMDSVTGELTCEDSREDRALLERFG